MALAYRHSALVRGWGAPGAPGTGSGLSSQRMPKACYDGVAAIDLFASTIAGGQLAVDFGGNFGRCRTNAFWCH